MTATAFSMHREATADRTQLTATDPITGVVGSYVFKDVANGDYIVCEVLQASWHQSLPNAGTGDLADCSVNPALGPNGYAFTMTGANHTGNDFGNFQNGTKSGTKFVDTNGNGQRDAGEPGLAGVEIHLFGTTGLGADFHQHTTTGADGAYSFSAPPGTYTACETVPAGYTQSYPNAMTPGTTNCPDPHGGRGWIVVLTSGSTDSGNDFGNFQPGTKSGTKFVDTNGNGQRDAGEPGLGGVEIHLFGATGLGADFHEHTTTAADGTYSIVAPPGNYTACETVPEGYIQSYPKADTPGTTSCAPTHNGRGWIVVLTSGSTDSGNDFGNFQPGTKSGTKFVDSNGDGDRDAGEPGLAGVEIHLFGTTGLGADFHEHTTTDANGAYSFSAPPGNYTACETVPAGYMQSYPTVLTENTINCLAPHGGRGWIVVLTSGSTDSGNDFGNFQNGTKSGTKFVDSNGDGDRDAGEPGLAGVEIHLFGTTGLGADFHEHTTTDANGAYSFSAPPGNYTACETVPAGYMQSYPTVLTENTINCLAPHGGRGWIVVLTSGSTDSGNDFGNFQNATVNGMKFKDADADGVKDPAETGLGGWVIHLFGTSGQGAVIHEELTTLADGTYSFTVAPGSYTVCEQTSGKPGWVQSFPTSGADCTGHTHDGTITPGPLGYLVNATSGGTFGDRDFGNKPASKIQVDFLPQALLPDNTTDATRATVIRCRDAADNIVGEALNANTLTTSDVFTNQSSLVCTITFVDP